MKQRSLFFILALSELFDLPLAYFTCNRIQLILIFFMLVNSGWYHCVLIVDFAAFLCYIANSTEFQNPCSIKRISAYFKTCP